MPVTPYRGGQTGPMRRRPTASRSGQALIESCLVMIMVCLVFFGIFQVSQLFAHKEVLHYAAGRGARAKTVGFNRFMVFKSIRVAAIPNAGRMLNPAPAGGPASQYAMEAPRIPLYMASGSFGELDPILDYENWESGQAASQAGAAEVGDGTLRVAVGQRVPLRYPFHRMFYDEDFVEMNGEARIDSHYTLYLDNQGW